MCQVGASGYASAKVRAALRHLDSSSLLPPKRERLQREKTAISKFVTTKRRACVPIVSEWVEHFSSFKDSSCCRGFRDSSVGRFKMDSQLVAGWLNGTHTFDEHPVIEPILRSATGKLYDLVRFSGLDIDSDSGLWISWKYRCYNLEADYMANWAMDKRATSEWWPDFTFYPAYNYIVSDGGIRNYSDSAAWAIRRVNSENVRGGLVGAGATFYRIVENHPSPSVPFLEAKGIQLCLFHFGRWRRLGSQAEECTLGCPDMVNSETHPSRRNR